MGKSCGALGSILESCRHEATCRVTPSVYPHTMTVVAHLSISILAACYIIPFSGAFIQECAVRGIVQLCLSAAIMGASYAGAAEWNRLGQAGTGRSNFLLYDGRAFLLILFIVAQIIVLAVVHAPEPTRACHSTTLRIILIVAISIWLLLAIVTVWVGMIRACCSCCCESQDDIDRRNNSRKQPRRNNRADDEVGASTVYPPPARRMQRSNGASRASEQQQQDQQSQQSDALDSAVAATKVVAGKGVEYGSKGLAMGKKHVRKAQAKAAERRASSSSAAPATAATSSSSRARPPPTNPEAGGHGDDDDYTFTQQY